MPDLDIREADVCSVCGSYRACEHDMSLEERAASEWFADEPLPVSERKEVNL